MGLNIRDWMIIVGALLIVAVLLDGYRRVRKERRGNIRMSLNKQFLNSTTDECEGSSELPSGGARAVERDNSIDSRDTDIHISEDTLNHNDKNITTDSSLGLQLDHDAPMLMESVESHYQSEPDRQTGISDEHAQQTAAEQKLATQVGDKEVMVINVIAKDDNFKGPDLLHILLACDVRFGEMGIFHRHEKANGSGAVQFSVANSVEPGDFNLDDIDNFSTPGVCFFMSVPGPKDVIEAFDCLVETAQCVVKNLNGELRDESRSVMTAQTLEHCRQRLVEFERRQLTQPA